MNNEFERDLLYNYLKDKIERGKELPIKNEIVYNTYQDNIIGTWTFKGLIKYIYDLEDKK